MAPERVPDPPPGVVIAHSLPSSGMFIGTPSLIRSPEGGLLASHDFFGPGSNHETTVIYLSNDEGATWEQISTVRGQFWSGLFSWDGRVFLIGPNRMVGNIVVRRSVDGGRSWSHPHSQFEGLLTMTRQYHSSSMPFVVHDGRIWRSMEWMSDTTKWPSAFEAFVMSAPVDADLRISGSWRFTNKVPFDPTALPGEGFLEGNVVPTRDGGLVLLMRMESMEGGVGARMDISPDGSSLSSPRPFNFPAAAVKFVVRWDEVSQLYWAMGNPTPKPRPDERVRAQFYRNQLALFTSRDLDDWKLVKVLASHPDWRRRGLHYPDFIFDGRDLLCVSRTSWDDAEGGPGWAHDSNMMTFHRVADFRSLVETDRAGRLSYDASPGDGA